MEVSLHARGGSIPAVDGYPLSLACAQHAAVFYPFDIDTSLATSRRKGRLF
jgi:hypothetical protein